MLTVLFMFWALVKQTSSISFFLLSFWGENLNKNTHTLSKCDTFTKRMLKNASIPFYRYVNERINVWCVVTGQLLEPNALGHTNSHMYGWTSGQTKHNTVSAFSSCCTLMPRVLQVSNAQTIMLVLSEPTLTSSSSCSSSSVGPVLHWVVRLS